MQLKNLAITFAILTSTTVFAVPYGGLFACPNDWWYCGECHNNGCKIAGLDYPCGHETTCMGDNGGKGALCGTKNGDFFNMGKDIECPDKA
ncbi:uncharacterized protein K452DRAFT_323106 [Aplosporella prunicola CBS 121167]|uniref:Uncharacterized protein n=1 Tax=Aplosporella prunicola CBS 121167 TaxID=1176127 RepID=A0A6A6AUJ5_9PEZI|nr:uncharacterized protein K452DRAFT_323106 [Aplosporella prunicola CBS 121167]KAF2135350.1 hypothetical protein K452DRAFT_323106 [Aplosporella prunicola CBS 121167]